MIEAKQLSKNFSNKVALSRLDLRVEPGHIYCLLGANGAGKSTTINCFLGFLEPDEGQAFISGLDVKDHKMRVRHMLAYIPENLMLYPELSGYENLRYFTSLSGLRYDKDTFHSFLLRSGLQSDAIDKRVAQYSKGMRQKVGIAIALAKKAKVLFLDEPTSGLDPRSANEFGEILEGLAEDGTAILMATHDLYRVIGTGTHIGIMRSGKLLETFAADQISHPELEKLYLKLMDTPL